MMDMVLYGTENVVDDRERPAMAYNEPPGVKSSSNHLETLFKPLKTRHSPVQIGEALYVKHVHLVDEQHSRHQLRDALVDVSIDHSVDLGPQLLRDLSLFEECLVH